MPSVPTTAHNEGERHHKRFCGLALRAGNAAFPSKGGGTDKQAPLTVAVDLVDKIILYRQNRGCGQALVAESC
ncbi:hypothetical protein GCM10009628_21110 [Paeniglutamicibacter kerguelensis]